jgi:hypothetical protein
MDTGIIPHHWERAMQQTFNTISAALVATLTVSAAVISTTGTASAESMRGERMSHSSHMHRGGHGFGRGAALGMAGGMIGALIVVAANQPYAESYDPKTGERIRSQGQPGRHVVTRTDGNGKTTRTVNKPQPDSASSTDAKTGITTTSTSNGNGTRTVVVTDAGGNVLSSEVVK